MGCGSKAPTEVEETAAQKADAEVNVKDWNDYVINVAPKIKAYADEIASDKTAEKEQAAGIVNADVAQKMADAEKSLTRTGMNPNSGKAISALAKSGDIGAKVESAAQVSTEQGIDSNQVAGLQQVSQIGMGQKVDAIDGMGNIAESSVREAISDASSDLSSHYDNLSLGMSAAGVAAGAGMDYFANKKAVAGSMSDYGSGMQDYIRKNAGNDYSVKGNNIYWND